MEQQSVKVYIYDLSRGMARSMSGAFLGKQIDGVWHTGIVVYGQEFFYGGMGVESCTPGQLPVLGQPDEIVELGKTEIPFEVFMDHLKELATTSFRATCYHLLDHNCNTFSNEVSLFLTGKPIPSKITNLPQEVMNTPLGAMLRPMIDAMQVSPGGTPMFESPVDGATGSSATAMSKPSSSDRKVKEFNTKVEADLAVESDEFDLLQGLVDGSSYHSTELNTLLKLLKWPNGGSGDTTKTEELKPASFWDSKVLQDFQTNRDGLLQDLTESQKSLLTDVHDYLMSDNCTWTPGRAHLYLIETIVQDRQSFKEELTDIIPRLLQNLVTKADILSLCTIDPESRNVIHNIVLKLEEYPVSMQEALLKVLCNLTETPAFLQSLSSDSQSSSTPLTRPGLNDLCRECLLNAESGAVTGVTAAFTFNLIMQGKLSDDTVTDLGMALVQTCTRPVPDIYAKYCLHSLQKCMQRNSEVAVLAAVMEVKIDDLGETDPSLENIKKKIKCAIQKVC